MKKQDQSNKLSLLQTVKRKRLIRLRWHGLGNKQSLLCLFVWI